MSKDEKNKVVCHVVYLRSSLGQFKTNINDPLLPPKQGKTTLSKQLF